MLCVSSRRDLNLWKPQLVQLVIFSSAAVGLLLISSSVSMVVPFGIGKVIDIIYTNSGEGNVTDRLKDIYAVLIGIFLLGGAANFGRVYLMRTSGGFIAFFGANVFGLFLSTWPMCHPTITPQPSIPALLTYPPRSLQYNLSLCWRPDKGMKCIWHLSLWKTFWNWICHVKCSRAENHQAVERTTLRLYCQSGGGVFWSHKDWRIGEPSVDRFVRRWTSRDNERFRRDQVISSSWHRTGNDGESSCD